MSAYIELLLVGNARAFISCADFAGVITGPDMAGETPATPDKPMSVLLHNGETIPGVYGISPNRLMLHVEGSKMILRKTGKFMMVAYVDSESDLEEQINSFLFGVRDE